MKHGSILCSAALLLVVSACAGQDAATSTGAAPATTAPSSTATAAAPQRATPRTSPNTARDGSVAMVGNGGLGSGIATEAETQGLEVRRGFNGVGSGIQAVCGTSGADALVLNRAVNPGELKGCEALGIDIVRLDVRGGTVVFRQDSLAVNTVLADFAARL